MENVLVAIHHHILIKLPLFAQLAVHHVKVAPFKHQIVQVVNMAQV